MSTSFCAFNLLILFLTCTTASKSTTRRLAEYPRDSVIGYIIALAVPLTDISERVYQSFNFEANYVLPDYMSGVSSYIPKDNERATSTGSDRVETVDIYSSIKKTLTRKNVYASIESQLFSIGFNGTACILKTICQTNEIPAYDTISGLFGSLFHIVFTPSSSEDENLPHHMYVAERNGLENKCGVYDADCPNSMLDFIAHTIT